MFIRNDLPELERRKLLNLSKSPFNAKIYILHRSDISHGCQTVFYLQIHAALVQKRSLAAMKETPCELWADIGGLEILPTNEFYPSRRMITSQIHPRIDARKL